MSLLRNTITYVVLVFSFSVYLSLRVYTRKCLAMRTKEIRAARGRAASTPLQKSSEQKQTEPSKVLFDERRSSILTRLEAC